MSNVNDSKPKNILPPSPQSQNTKTAIEEIRRLFVDVVQYRNIVNDKQSPAKRAAFIKQHGSVHGIFQVCDDLDEKYQVGIFQPGEEYPVWMRFSSDIKDSVPDKNSTVGIGIKLFNVPGKKTLEGDENATTLDLILQNTEVFFAADAREMSEFKTAAVNGTLDAFLKEHPETERILNEMESRTVESLLLEPLWSCIPYKFGVNEQGGYEYCKYEIKNPLKDPPRNPTDKDDPDYLAKDLQERLYDGEVRLDFNIQLRNNPATQSIISARSRWDLQEAVPVKVATIIIPQQKILAHAQGVYGESLSFNPWRTLEDMAPVGSIAEARKVVYRSSALVRRNINGQSVGEPNRPRPPGASLPYDSSFDQPWPSNEVTEPELPAPDLPAPFMVVKGVPSDKLPADTAFPEVSLRVPKEVYPSYITTAWFNEGEVGQTIPGSTAGGIVLVDSGAYKNLRGNSVEYYYTVVKSGKTYKSKVSIIQVI